MEDEKLEQYVKEYLSTRKQIDNQMAFLMKLLDRHDDGVKHVTNYNTEDANIDDKPKKELDEVRDKLADLINFLGKTKTANMNKKSDADSKITNEWK
jgi:hypothetical protein